jgi:hypothetical protein
MTTTAAEIAPSRVLAFRDARWDARWLAVGLFLLMGVAGDPEDRECVIRFIAPNSPAEGAGLQVGDVIKTFNTERIRILWKPFHSIGRVMLFRLQLTGRALAGDYCGASLAGRRAMNLALLPNSAGSFASVAIASAGNFYTAKRSPPCAAVSIRDTSLRCSSSRNSSRRKRLRPR